MSHGHKVLSQEQVSQLYFQMKLGDMDARNQLIESNTGLVGYIIKKYLNHHYEADELFNIGCIGLIRAIDTYDISKGVSLCSYAYICIENTIVAYLRYDKKNLKTISLDAYLGKDSEKRQSSTRLEHLIVPNSNESNDNYELQEIRKIIRALIKELEPKYQTLILMRFGFIDGQIYTQQEISEELGLSRPYVSKLEKKALCKLKKMIELQELY
jgi:RNA polymerase sporulation-specific sigma factor